MNNLNVTSLRSKSEIEICLIEIKMSFFSNNGYCNFFVVNDLVAFLLPPNIVYNYFI